MNYKTFFENNLLNCKNTAYTNTNLAIMIW